jgi:hypothetical protein
MDVVINGSTELIPAKSKSLTTQGDYFLNLLASLGYAPDNPPLGALFKKMYNLKGEWIAAIPMHWEATHNDAMILSAGFDLQLKEQEAKAWFIEISSFLAQDGIQMYFHDSHTWLLCRTGKPELFANPPHYVIHQSLMPLLRSMDTTHYWQKILTELQMFLASHPLNQHSGIRSTINGVWLYGGGELTLEVKQTIVTDDERLLSIFPEQSIPLDLNSLISPTSLVFISDPGNLDQLKQRLPNIPIHWFWNNTAYQTKKISFWRRFFHANNTKRIF